MDSKEFRKQAHQLADWMADYHESIEQWHPKSLVEPREIYELIPDQPPLEQESFEAIFQDFKDHILKGITHWQHPSFFAYFPANNSFPSILAEMLTATMGAQCMVWETSPAATELEEKMMDWLKKMMGIPEEFSGVIQDTASSATLCSILTARERYTQYQSNLGGLDHNRFRIYCSEQTHSSIDKAVRISGIGSNNLVKIPVDERFSIQPALLEVAIQKDLAEGFIPLCVIANIGTTTSTSVDSIPPLAAICQKYHLFLHVDAAYAGTAAILPEMRRYFEGLELADSYVFNPHKWMFTNFDCSAYFVKDKGALIQTFEILPEYLKTKNDAKVNNYRDWGIPLGRRFRALKLWFVIRSFGVEGIREKLRHHLQLTRMLEEKIEDHPDFELLAPVIFNTLCFRFKPSDISDENLLNIFNQTLLERLNAGGEVYLTHSKLNGKYTIRVVIGQTNVQESHVLQLWDHVLKTKDEIKKNQDHSFTKA